jgi:hypothetical protein
VCAVNDSGTIGGVAVLSADALLLTASATHSNGSAPGTALGVLTGLCGRNDAPVVFKPILRSIAQIGGVSHICGAAQSRMVGQTISSLAPQTAESPPLLFTSDEVSAAPSAVVRASC